MFHEIGPWYGHKQYV